MRDGTCGTRGASGGGPGLGKKIRLVNGPAPGHGSWPVGQVRV